MGLWLVQQCRATWTRQGEEYDYDHLVHLAEEAEPFRSLVDPDDPEFLPPGDMPARIREFCRRSGQPIPESPGQTVRAVYESLALKYRYVLEQLTGVSGRQVDRLHIIGGGSKIALLSQMAADATGRPVVTGPDEATAMGNALIQLIALGELGGVQEARQMLSQSINTTTYEPRETAAWDEAYRRFRDLLTTI
jgi:rhamnulokinase